MWLIRKDEDDFDYDLYYKDREGRKDVEGREDREHVKGREDREHVEGRDDREATKEVIDEDEIVDKENEWLNQIEAVHWARSYFTGRAKTDVLLNNICEVFNARLVDGRDKPIITALEFEVELNGHSL
ncbi:hypothetical protein L1987_69436 [Smallanthus sonchifolius]|uniref:Uncharacterized protein n=1 Tax=Smallanthus sonchifolius TaxID=185202 RepID=A0ACB9B6H5_9ASTR|nr:hypothetical protein L1987_69436 [Smallanthus sonchifolius]